MHVAYGRQHLALRRQFGRVRVLRLDLCHLYLKLHLVRQELIRLGVLKAEKDERAKDSSPRTCLESGGA